MAEFPVMALWGNENAELLFYFFFSLVWGLVCGDFGGESGRHGSLGTSYLKFIL